MARIGDACALWIVYDAQCFAGQYTLCVFADDLQGRSKPRNENIGWHNPAVLKALHSATIQSVVDGPFNKLWLFLR
jgi:hypothetical protein